MERVLSPTLVVTEEGTSQPQRNAGTKRRMVEAGIEEPAPQLPAPPTRTLVKQPMLMPLQELVNVCRAALTNGTSIPPTRHAVNFICSAMDKVGMFDVGLMDEIGFFLSRNLEPQNPPVLVTCKTIYKCANNFVIKVLYMSRGAAMPLHDHPGMTVFTKLLVGSAHVEAYDWVRPDVHAAGPGSAMLAEKVRDGRLAARSAAAWALLPGSGGDLNSFVAGQRGPCVLLQVFTPLYSAAEQYCGAFYQHSPYYELDLNVVPYEVSEERKPRLAWARKIDEPKDVIKIVSLPYRYKGTPIA